MSDAVTPEKVLIEVYNTNFDRIYKYFYFKTLNREDTEDLTSQTFYAFTEKLRNNAQIENPNGYISGIAKNVFAQFLRKKYKSKEIPADDLLENIEAIHESKLAYKLQRTAALAINKLPHKQALVLKLRLIDKLTLKEIAEKLHKSMNYVKTTQKRAIKSARKLLACTPPAT